MRKEILEKRRDRLTEKRDGLTAKALASNDAAEVRSINEQISDLNEQISFIDEDLKLLVEDETRSAPPAGAKLVNGDVVGSFKMESEKRDLGPTETMEYRKAFMSFVQNGTPIPEELRAGSAINTNGTSPAIPLTVMNEVINTVRKRYGNLYAKVRKMSVPGGVQFPIGALRASFKWINESTVSPKQSIGSLDKVSFSYHTGEIRVAQTFLSNLLTLDAFEAQIAECIAVAYLEAMDSAIVNGTGDGMPLGILNDPRVLATNNVVEMTSADLNDWQKWRKNFFAKLPLGYRSGEFIFPLGTVDAYLETMSDSNNNPVFRQATGLEVNDGDAQDPNGRFFGRNISLVEPDILPDFDTASANDVIGIFWQPREYAINENFAFTMRRYFDEIANEWIDKALVVVDGKTLNPEGFWLIKKKT